MTRRALAALSILALAPLGGPPASAQEKTAPLLDASSKAVNQTAPATYKAKFVTTHGVFVIEVHRDWAPLGADRFYNLVKNGFFDDTAFFRVVPNFVVQFGLSGDPKISSVWRDAKIKDDPVKQSNKRGFLTFATAGPNTRTTQVFISLKDNERLDAMGFSAFGQVVKGMEVVDALYSQYGDGIDQSQIQTVGNEFLKKNYPKLDKTTKATIVK